MVLSLDDQIEAAGDTLRLLRFVGKLLMRRKTPSHLLTGFTIDCCVGMEAVLANLRFQKEHEVQFRSLARQIIQGKRMLEEMEQDPAVQAVLEAFPGAEITNVEEMEDV